MYPMTATLSGLYVDCFTLGQGLLKIVPDVHEVTVTDQDAALIEEGMLTMPGHPDVAKGLTMLNDKGFGLVTRTNSPPIPGGQSPLEHAVLGDCFERQFSIEACRAYKPSAHVYHYVSQELGGCALSVDNGGRPRLGHRRSPERRLQFSVDHPPRQRAADRPTPARTEYRRSGSRSTRARAARIRTMP
jgi:hypothetical protein